MMPRKTQLRTGSIQRRSTRGDCRLEALRRKIADDSDLPPECLRLINPDGRVARRDKRLAQLRQDYGRNAK